MGRSPCDEFVIRGGSCVVDRFGTVPTGPVFDRRDVLVADLDVSGHYARPDLFRLTTTRSARRGCR